MAHPKQQAANVEPEIVDADDAATTAGAEDSQIAQLTQERDANFDRFLRAQAELDTARRRWRQEMDELRKYQAMPIAKDLLPSLDNLRRAVDAAKAGTTVEALKTGVEMVLQQIDEVLARHEAKPITAVGVPFDPNLHEAIMQVPSADQEPMTVVLEAERGYRMHDRVVRPSKVGVAVAPAQ